MARLVLLSVLWIIWFGTVAMAAPRLCLLGVPPSPQHRAFYEGFFEGLRDLGYVEGRTVSVDYRGAGADAERFGPLAEECVRLRPDVIVAATTPAALAAKRTTQAIPIVMMGASDPLVTGLVESLARPGGNVTGQAAMEGDIAGKRLEVLREIVPRLRRLLVITYAADPATAPQLQRLQAAAHTFGISLVVRDVRSIEVLPSAFAAGVREDVDAVLWTTATFFGGHRERVADLVARHKLPTTGYTRLDVQAGALSSYGINWRDFWRGAATYVDRILRGAKPTDLPVAQPTRFELWINAITAKKLGIVIPPPVLVRADHIIQ